MLKLSILLALFSISPVFSILPSVEADEEEKPVAVCKSTPKIPNSYVVIAEDSFYDCRTSGIVDNGKNGWWLIKPTKDEEVVCKGSPVPDPYAVVSEVKTTVCPGGSTLIESKNAWLIRRIESKK